MKKISFFILIIFSIVAPLTAYAATLLEAARDGDIKTVIDLLDKGADVNEQNAYGVTALMAAAIHNDTEIVRLLLDRGAQVDKQDNNGETALLMVASLDNPEAAGLLLDILDRGAQINKQDDSGMTALGWAALWGNAEIARSLIDKGADIDATIAGLEKSASAASERKDHIWAFGVGEAVTMLKEMKR